MTPLPVPVLAAALAAASALPLLGWAILARPQTTAAQTRDNLTRGIALPADRTAEPGPVGAGVTAGRAADPRGHRCPAGPAGRPRRPARRLAGVEARRREAGAGRGRGRARGPGGQRGRVDPRRGARAGRDPGGLLRARAAAVQPGAGAAGGDRSGARRHPRPDDHRRGGRARLRVGHEPRGKERQGAAGRGADAHAAGHRRGSAAPGGLPGAGRAHRGRRTCVASSPPSSRPTPTASRSPTCCAPRRRRCG